jgi:ArsR family transcriptional regulator, virulence genes transcriptional regulator
MYERLFSLQEEVLKSLANKKRLELVQLLNGHELTVNQMVAMLGISQSNVSQHLSVLRRLKLVKVRKVGLNAYYSLTDDRITTVITALRDFLKSQYGQEPEIAEIAHLDEASTYPIVRDPVCGMRFSASSAAYSMVFEGDMHYFCAEGCKNEFAAAQSKQSNQLTPAQASAT